MHKRKRGGNNVKCAFVSVAIYRGCFDAFKAVKQLTDDYIGCRNQTWNNRVRRWCLCDTDLCNRFPIEQNYVRLPNVPSHRHSRVHHHPLPPPQPARSENYVQKEAGAAETISLNPEEKSVQPALYRTIWTNWQALPRSHAHNQPADRRTDEAAERKTNAGSTSSQDHLGQVVSHSVYPDRWKENVAAVVDRRHAKSSDNVATRGRPEPLNFGGAEGQMSRSNYSAPPPPRLHQYQPPNTEFEAKPATAERQSLRGMLISCAAIFLSRSCILHLVILS